MPAVDWFILGFYLLGTAMVGVFVGKFVRKSSDMFTASGAF
jgi:hypothetical protein